MIKILHMYMHMTTYHQPYYYCLVNISFKFKQRLKEIKIIIQQNKLIYNLKTRCLYIKLILSLYNEVITFTVK